MGAERVVSLRVAGTLHDVGKLGVPTRLLRKSGPLTDEEYQQVVLHPEYGHELVRGIGFLGEARAGILHHHERMDGRGYPHGLAGAEIPEFARVIAVADAFDSMTSTRSYRRGRPVPEALAELERCAGSQFDPAMVTALVRALERTHWQPALLGREADEQAPEVPLGAREPLPRVPAPAGARQAGGGGVGARGAGRAGGGVGGAGSHTPPWWRR
jgi:HD-GYP domain-containing protein (c-di-GMP phosphodiesterase class II)